jgi:hypothetical protein
MVSLIEELEAREAAARVRVEELEAGRCHVVKCVGFLTSCQGVAEVGSRVGAQASAGRPAMPVTWSQIAKRMVISDR